MIMRPRNSESSLTPKQKQSVCTSPNTTEPEEITKWNLTSAPWDDELGEHERPMPARNYKLKHLKQIKPGSKTWRESSKPKTPLLTILNEKSWKIQETNSTEIARLEIVLNCV